MNYTTPKIYVDPSEYRGLIYESDFDTTNATSHNIAARIESDMRFNQSCRLGKVYDQYTYKRGRKMLRYENIGTACIKIDLHNRNYSVVAIAKWNKETEKYTATLYLKENSVELLDLMEKYKDIEFESDSSSIRNAILQEVSKLNDYDSFKYYMDRYDLEQKCFDRGLEIVTREELNK